VPTSQCHQGPPPGLLGDDRLRPIWQDARCTSPERVATLIDAWRGGGSYVGSMGQLLCHGGQRSGGACCLIFVAMSINPEVIIRNTTHKNRLNMLSVSPRFSWHAVSRLSEIQPLERLALSGLSSGLSRQPSSSGLCSRNQSRRELYRIDVPRLGRHAVLPRGSYRGDFSDFRTCRGALHRGYWNRCFIRVPYFGAWLIVIGVYEDQTRR